MSMTADNTVQITVAFNARGEPVVKNARRRVRELGDEANRSTRGLSRMGGGLQNLRSNLGSVLKYVALMTAGIAAFTAVTIKAVRAGAAFETQLAGVSTMLNRGQLGQQQYLKLLDQYGQGLRRMRVEFGESTETLSKGLYDILSASIDPAKALQVLQVSAKAAKAGMTDTATAVDFITSALNAYALAAEKAEWVSDVAFATVASGKTTFAELASSIGKVAPTANMAGISLDQLGAMMATTTQAGINTAWSATAINAMILAFIRATPQSVQAWKQISAGTSLAGTELGKTLIQGDNLVQTLGVLRGATDKQLTQMFMEVEALKAVNVLMAKTDTYTGSLARTSKAAGETQEAYNKVIQTTEAQINRAKEAVRSIWEEMGRELLPVVRDAAEDFADWYLEMKESGAVGRALGPVISVIKGQIEGMTLIVQWARDNWDMLTKAMQTFIRVNPWAMMAIKSVEYAGKGVKAIFGDNSTASKVLDLGEKGGLEAINKRLAEIDSENETAAKWERGGYGPFFQKTATEKRKNLEIEKQYLMIQKIAREREAKRAGLRDNWSRMGDPSQVVLPDLVVKETKGAVKGGGGGKGGAGQAGRLAEAVRRIRERLTEDIKELSLGEYEYQRWLVDRRIEDARRSDAFIRSSAEDRKAIEGQLAEYKNLKLDEIQERELVHYAERLAEAERTARAELEASRRAKDGAARAFAEYADQAADAARQVEDAVSGNLRSMEDALVDFARTGKLAFSDLTDSIIADLARIAIRQNITGPLSSALSGLFSSEQTLWSSGTGMSWVVKKHRGGGGPGGPGRLVPDWLFAGAPRLHDGLRPDEYPAILQRGEEVKSRADVAAGRSEGRVDVHIHNDSGQPLQVTGASARLDPSGWVVDVVIDSIRRNRSGARDVVKGAQYG